MTAVTRETIETKRTELNKLIEQFNADASNLTFVKLPEPELHAGVTLTPRGRYKGTEDGYTREQLVKVMQGLLEQVAQIDWYTLLRQGGFVTSCQACDYADKIEDTIRTMIGKIK